MRETLIANGVRNLKTFGYPGVTPENILTDPLYRAFFRSNLEDWASMKNREVSKAAKALLVEIDA